MGGRVILIKSVLQAIPSYAMSCFKVLVNLCKELHWLNWDMSCNPNGMAGVGFRHLTEFNKTLLAKKVWKIFQSPKSLMERILKARYIKHVDIMQAGLGNTSSYVW